MQQTRHDFFPPGNLDPKFSDWISTSPVLLHQVTITNGILPISTLLPSPTISFMDQGKYHQLSRFVKPLPQPIFSLSDLTPLERLLVGDQPPEKPISYFYQALLILNPSVQPTFLSKWEQGLQSPLSEMQRLMILQLTNISSISSKTTEGNYKMLTRWHYTPVVLHKIFLSILALCWRGCGEQPTHAHIWWFCPHIRPYWATVLYWIKEIQGYAIPNDPWVILFNCTGKSIGQYKKSITPHLLNAAKALIPRLWKQQTIPTLR